MLKEIIVMQKIIEIFKEYDIQMPDAIFILKNLTCRIIELEKIGNTQKKELELGKDIDVNLN